MCGRFTLKHSTEEVVERFEVDDSLFTISPRYNIAPTQPVAVITSQSGVRRLEGYRWGLVPSWAKDIQIGNKMINARAETLVEKPSFKQALIKRRCLIPADGFYEWQKFGKAKQPLYIRQRNQQLFAFAGLWDEWQAPDGSPLRSCTIITIEPNELIAPIHNRMAAMLSLKAEAAWLDESLKEPRELVELLKPYPADQLEAYRVSRHVNSPTRETPDCIKAVEDEDVSNEEAQNPRLF